MWVRQDLVTAGISMEMQRKCIFAHMDQLNKDRKNVYTPTKELTFPKDFTLRR